jgi:hypothetical protein
MFRYRLSYSELVMHWMLHVLFRVCISLGSSHLNRSGKVFSNTNRPTHIFRLHSLNSYITLFSCLFNIDRYICQNPTQKLLNTTDTKLHRP